MSKLLPKIPLTPANKFRLATGATGLVCCCFWNFWNMRLINSPKLGFFYDLPISQQAWDFLHGRFNHEFIGYIGLLLLAVATLPPTSIVIREGWLFKKVQGLHYLLYAYWVTTMLYILYRLSGQIPYYVDFSNRQYIFYPYAFVAMFMLNAELQYYSPREVKR